MLHLTLDRTTSLTWDPSICSEQFNTTHEGIISVEITIANVVNR